MIKLGPVANVTGSLLLLVLVSAPMAGCDDGVECDVTRETFGGAPVTAGLRIDLVPTTGEFLDGSYEIAMSGFGGSMSLDLIATSGVLDCPRPDDAGLCGAAAWLPGGSAVTASFAADAEAVMVNGPGDMAGPERLDLTLRRDGVDLVSTTFAPDYVLTTVTSYGAETCDEVESATEELAVPPE